MEKKFLARFFPPLKYISSKATIATLSQGIDEHFCEAWERYKAILKKCLNRGFDDITQLNMLYSGLRPQTKMLLDASAVGTVITKSAKEVIIIIDSLATSDH